jgi:hypothetical protein
MRPPLVLLCLLTAPPFIMTGSASSEDIIIQARQELELWHDSDLDESVADERLDAFVGYGNFSLQATFLIHQPTDASRLDPSDYGEPFEGVRKRMLEARVGPALAQLGEVYTTLARGVGLQLIENQVVDFDNGVDGFRTAWEDPRFRVEFLAGRNSFGTREASLKAASVGWTGPSLFDAALHATQVDSSDDAAGRLRGRDRIGGGELNFQTSWGDLHASYFGRDYEPPGGVEAPPLGHGAYGTMNLYYGPAALTLEGHDYRRYDWAYTIPPTGVRQHTTTLLNRTSHTANFNPEDQRGYQAEFLVNLMGGDLEILANRAAGESHDGELPYFENYGQVEWTLWPNLVVIGRGAETEETIDEGAKVVFFERITWGGNVYWSFAETWSLELDFETQKLQELDLETAEFSFPLEARDNILTVNLFHAPWLAMAVTHEWTDNPREEKDRWTFAEVNFQVMDRHQINIGGGSFRGGQLCSGGICRPVAPFTGVRVNWQTTF